jgi:hypothetical protein
MKKRIGLALLLLGAAFSQAQENYKTTWTGHRILGLSAGSAGIAANVLKFPILVRLGAADSAVFAASKLNGADIRFTKTDSVARLSHEIEKWDSAGRSAAIWVKVDTVYATGINRLVMHWGNAAAADSSKSTAVFDTASGYQGVWHMNGTSDVANENDATANGFNAVPFNGVNPVAGIIGGARNFLGGDVANGNNSGTAANNDYFRVPNSATGKLAFAKGSRYTISVWARPTTSGNWHRTLVAKHDRNFAVKINASNRFEAFEYNGNRGLFTVPPRTNYGWHAATAPTQLAGGTINQWYHIVGVRDSLAQTIYVNGVLTASHAGVDTAAPAAGASGYSQNGTTVPILDSAVIFGRQQESTNRYWAGDMDEIRMSSVLRDSNWIKLEYANQKAAQTLVASVPSNIYYVMPGTGNTPRDTVVLQTGVAVNLPLNYTGGPVDSVAVTTGTLPAGVTLNKFTGALSGTPTTVTAAASQTITLYTPAGNATRGLRFSVIAGSTSNLHYGSDTLTYAVGIQGSNSPTYTGRAPTGYSITPALTKGLSLNVTNGAISGTPTDTLAATNYTVKATNTTDTTTRVVRITIGPAEVYSTWGQHKTIWLNTASNGAAVTQSVRKFPVLLRLDTSNFTGFTQAAGTGADIRFTKNGDVVRLPHQIESWDSAGKKAAVWVLIDTVIGSNNTQTFRMHWAKSGVTNLSNGNQVFDTANGFKAVWHMNGSTDASNEVDATANGLTAYQTSSPVAVAGVIGGARNFVNTGTTSTDYFTVTGSASILNLPVNGNYTLSAWTNLNATTTHQTLISKYDNAYALKLTSGGLWEFFEFNAGWNSANGLAAETGVWHHIVGGQNGAEPFLYMDGVRVDAGPLTTASTAARNDALDLLLGSEPQTATTRRRPYIGIADELRIVALSRDADWAKLEYENQKPAGQTLVAYTQPTSIGPNGELVAQAQGFSLSAKVLGDGMVFRVQGAGAARIKVSLTDMRGRPVWSTAVASQGASDILWNGTTHSGMRASNGVYALRVTLLDAQNKVLKTLDRKLPFTH